MLQKFCCFDFVVIARSQKSLKQSQRRFNLEGEGETSFYHLKEIFNFLQKKTCLTLRHFSIVKYLFKQSSAFMVSKTLRHLSVPVQIVHISASFFLETILNLLPRRIFKDHFYSFQCERQNYSESLLKKTLKYKLLQSYGTVPILFLSFKKYLKSWDIAQFQNLHHSESQKYYYLQTRI